MMDVCFVEALDDGFRELFDAGSDWSYLVWLQDHVMSDARTIIRYAICLPLN